MSSHNNLANIDNLTKNGYPRGLHELPVDQLRKWIDSFDTVLCDCDGVLWLGTTLIKDSDKALQLFRDLGKQIFYVTNNSTKTRDQLVTQFQNLGFKASKDEIISTAYLTACYLKDLNFQKKAYIIGAQSISEELKAVGIDSIGFGPDHLDCLVGELVSNFQPDPDIGAVIVGFDEHFSYPKLFKASTYANMPGALFIATNTDDRVPVKNKIIPGTGSMVTSVETVVRREAFKIGKPNNYTRSSLERMHHIVPERTLMIGDRANTDILFGHRCGFQTLLVLTGITTIPEVHQSVQTGEHELVPHLFLSKLGDVVPLVEQLNI